MTRLFLSIVTQNGRDALKPLWHQCRRALGQGQQGFPPGDGSGEQKYIVNNRPLPTISLRVMSVGVPVGLDRPPEAREAHCIAECVYQNDGQQAPRPQKEKRGVGTEQGRVTELQHGASHGSDEGYLGMSDTELVKVMNMGKAENDRRKEDGLRQRHTSAKEKWDRG